MSENTGHMTSSSGLHTHACHEHAHERMNTQGIYRLMIIESPTVALGCLLIEQKICRFGVSVMPHGLGNGEFE